MKSTKEKIRELIPGILGVIILLLVMWRWQAIWALLKANTTILYYLLVVILAFFFIGTLYKGVNKKVFIDRLWIAAGLAIAIVIFIGQDNHTKAEFLSETQGQNTAVLTQAQNEATIFNTQNQIDQQRITDSAKELTNSTLAGLIAATQYDCEIAATIVQSFQATSSLTQTFTTIQYVDEPYIDNLSFLSQQFNGKYDQTLMQAIAYMESINTLESTVIGINVQGSTASVSPDTASLVMGYNTTIVQDSQEISNWICSGFKQDLQNKIQ